MDRSMSMNAAEYLCPVFCLQIFTFFVPHRGQYKYDASNGQAHFVHNKCEFSGVYSACLKPHFLQNKSDLSKTLKHDGQLIFWLCIDANPFFLRITPAIIRVTPKPEIIIPAINHISESITGLFKISE
ncbi:MAG: hypothetical protein II998_08125 [Clostridia bacterium]|nr:hypothetical protein [Clostridia bacterium]